MGRPGLTQTRFDEVADKMLAAGERPTVERMRQALGTGSSQTVQRLLDVWWKALGARLTANAAKLALPEAPEPVVALASQFWEQALAAARSDAEAALEADRAALAAHRLEADVLVAAADDRTEAAVRQSAEAVLAAELVQARFDDSQRLIDRQAAQIVDLLATREALTNRVGVLEAEASDLRMQLDRVKSEANDAREANAQHIRNVEDRAHQEVDRARQDALVRTRQIEVLQRDRQREAEAAQEQIAVLRNALSTSQQVEAAERARRETLEEQLAQIRADIRENLRAAETRAKRSPRAASPGAVKPARASKPSRR
jgi:hypothetical protein